MTFWNIYYNMMGYNYMELELMTLCKLDEKMLFAYKWYREL